jgi:ribosomal protein S18 acetylase RimI-like enzyme
VGSHLDVSGAPAIRGLTFRRFRGRADYPVMVSILDACNDADGLDYVNTVEDIALVFSHLVNCDPCRDMLFAEVHGETVAFSRVWWVQENGPRRLYKSLGFVHPAWRRKGLGEAMLHHSEDRLCEIASTHPEGEKVLRTWATDGEYGALALFAGSGYLPVRHYVQMIRPIGVPLPAAPMPQGLEVRPVEPDHIRAIWEAKEEALCDHWGHTPATEQEYERWTRSRLFAPDLWKVAWDGKQVAGVVLNRLDEAQNQEYERRRGYTAYICVRRPWRRRGLARSLLVQSIAMFRELGMEETALGVDTQNLSRALNLYEGVGYRMTRRHTFFDKRLDGAAFIALCAPGGARDE